MPERDEVIETILRRLAEQEIPENHIELCESLLEDNYRSLEYPIDEIKLDHLQIENFRVIEEEKIDFNNQNTVLFGDNKRGKTTSLEAIRFNLLGLHEKQRITLTGPIRDGKSTLVTNGNWSVDNRDYLIRRILTNGTSYKETVRSNRNPENLEDIPFGAPTTQETVSREIGLWPIESKQLGRYNIFSLYFLMQGHYKKFLRWQEKDDLLDILFGIDLASVTTESTRFREDELKLSDKEETAAEDLKNAQSTVSTLKEDLNNLKRKEENVETRLADRKSELRRVRELLESEDELRGLESQETQIKRQISKLEDERRDSLSKLRRVEQRISHLQEMDMGEHLHEPSLKLQKYMSVPDRCPICTEEVEDYQRQRLLHDQDCPLCGKHVPDERIEIGTERDVREKIQERESQQEELEVAQEERQEIEGEIDLLKSRIDDYENELQEVQNQIEQSNEKELIDRKNELESAVDRLEQEATNVQVEINARKREIKDIDDDLREFEKLYESRKDKVEKRQSLKTFERIVQNQINRERQSIRADLEVIMKEMLEIFEDGTYSPAFDVDFDSSGGYGFVIRVRDGDDIPSDRPNENSNEGKLTALLFHTAVLRLLTQHGDTLPLRLFIVDSPYSEAPDTGNAPDITRFLKRLPDLLPEYQLILGVANTTLTERESFVNRYNVLDF